MRGYHAKAYGDCANEDGGCLDAGADVVGQGSRRSLKTTGGGVVGWGEVGGAAERKKEREGRCCCHCRAHSPPFRAGGKNF